MNARPWTVYLLAAWTVGGSLWNLLASGGNVGVRLLWFFVAIWFARAYWRGAAWAFTWSFMLASLCMGLLVTVLLIQTFLMEEAPAGSMLLSAATSGVLIVLLVHPATKRFARVEERPTPATTA